MRYVPKLPKTEKVRVLATAKSEPKYSDEYSTMLTLERIDYTYTKKTGTV